MATRKPNRVARPMTEPPLRWASGNMAAAIIFSIASAARRSTKQKAWGLARMKKRLPAAYEGGPGDGLEHAPMTLDRRIAA
jgi:hypothetical protein